MSWPTLIQLHNSEYSHSYDGSEIRETWYVEPYDAVTAFCAAMLGRVDVAGHVPYRTLPAAHFLYNFCLATEARMVPLDPRSLSYAGTTALNPVIPVPGNAVGNYSRITTAVGTIQNPSGVLAPTRNVDATFVSQANRTFSAGALICVTYKPVLTVAGGTDNAIQEANMDFVNYGFVTRTRKNVPNAGLKLITPPGILNALGAGGLFYPSAGIAPELAEDYEELIVERRMLNPQFNLATLSQYQNVVDAGDATDPAGNVYPSQTLKFRHWEPNFVQVPSVDANGEPNGYNRWLNLRLFWDWRTTLAVNLLNSDGGSTGNAEPVTWNHVLAYPGTLAWLVSGTGLAWYYAKFSSQSIGVDTPAFPLGQQTVQNFASILDPLTINP